MTLGRSMKDVLAAADEPDVVAGIVLKAAGARHPKLRFRAGALPNRLRLLRRFAPAGVRDAGIRKDLRLYAVPTSTRTAGVDA
jgi:hypothetical protein